MENNPYLTHAIGEFDLLKAQDENYLIEEFRKPILNLVKAFSKSGQSGSSAPHYAGAISSAIKNLLLFDPILPLTGNNSEWCDVGEEGEEGKGITVYQNKRLGSVFKKGKHGKPYYLDAIIFEETFIDDETGEEIETGFTGNVELIDYPGVSSAMEIKEFPFTPKEFHVRVREIHFEDEACTIRHPKGQFSKYEVLDEATLKKALVYYNVRS